MITVSIHLPVSFEDFAVHIACDGDVVLVDVHLLYELLRAFSVHSFEAEHVASVIRVDGHDTSHHVLGLVNHYRFVLVDAGDWIPELLLRVEYDYGHYSISTSTSLLNLTVLALTQRGPSYSP